MLLLMDLHFYNSALAEKYLVKELEITERVKELHKANDKYKLGDLFEVKYGLLEQRFNRVYINKDGKKEDVVFIKPSMVRENDNHLESADRIKNMSGIPEKFSDAKKNIETKDLLSSDDYLLTTKGFPRLIDLSTFKWESGLNLVATHHFITLKPKENILNKLNIDKKFLKNILMLIIQKKLSVDYEKSIFDFEKQLKVIKENNDKRSIKTLIPAIKINSIKDINISVPRSIDEQNKLIATIDDLENIRKFVNDNIDLWHKYIVETNSK